MLLMNQMDGILADQRYTIDSSNATLQAPKIKELQKQLTSFLTILTYPKPPQNM